MKVIKQTISTNSAMISPIFAKSTNFDQCIGPQISATFYRIQIFLSFHSINAPFSLLHFCTIILCGAIIISPPCLALFLSMFIRALKRAATYSLSQSTLSQSMTKYGTKYEA